MNSRAVRDVYSFVTPPPQPRPIPSRLVSSLCRAVHSHWRTCSLSLTVMKKNPVVRLAAAIAAFLFAASILRAAPYQMENLGRGVVAVRTGSNSVYVGWRLLGLDPSGIGFNVYRGSTKVNSSVLTTSTNLPHTAAPLRPPHPH